MPPYSTLSYVQSPNRCEVLSENWRLVFFGAGDRWSHRLEVLQGETWVPGLTAVEGEPDDRWPPSPALQDLFQERLSDTCVELQLVGQAGRSHYSAAVRCDSAKGFLDFDVAVRLQPGSVPARLGSTYQVHLADLTERPDWRFEIVPLLPGPDAKLVESTTPTGRTMVVQPVVETASRAQTIRWRYQLTGL